MELLTPNWYIESPLDFEHKEYIFYAFLQDVDSSYGKKMVSPYLLHLEKLREEMYVFQRNLVDMKIRFNSTRYQWFDNPKLEGEENELIEMVSEIIDFSLPQIENRILIGNRIYKKYNQILW